MPKLARRRPRPHVALMVARISGCARGELDRDDVQSARGTCRENYWRPALESDRRSTNWEAESWPIRVVRVVLRMRGML